MQDDELARAAKQPRAFDALGARVLAVWGKGVGGRVRQAGPEVVGGHWRMIMIRILSVNALPSGREPACRAPRSPASASNRSRGDRVLRRPYARCRARARGARAR